MFTTNREMYTVIYFTEKENGSCDPLDRPLMGAMENHVLQLLAQDWEENRYSDTY